MCKTLIQMLDEIYNGFENKIESLKISIRQSDWNNEIADKQD